MNQAKIISLGNTLQAERGGVIAALRAQAAGLPFSAFTTMVLLGLLAVCVTAGVHTQTELKNAVRIKLELQERERAATQLNAKLQKEIQELSNNPCAIERAARKMGMVKADEMVIVIPQKSR